jgi:probable F420-dependent oxidoreductase
VGLGTGIAIAYAHSPFSTAQAAWDLQRFSRGRFKLGLATQVKAHIERRYGVPWPGGVGALEEYVACCRAVWKAFQSGTKPAFEGRHYRCTLINPEFNPGPLPQGQDDIPVWLAAVGTHSARLAGRVAHGLHVHAFHTDGYLREVLMPEVTRGRAEAGGVFDPDRPIEATCSVFAGIAHDERQARIIRDRMREYVAFYASTPAYKPVLEHAGCADIHEPLRLMTRQDRWADMPALVDDAILDKFLVVDAPKRLGERLAKKYDGLLTELALYREGGQFASEKDWDDLLTGLGARR